MGGWDLGRVAGNGGRECCSPGSMGPAGDSPVGVGEESPVMGSPQPREEHGLAEGQSVGVLPLTQPRACPGGRVHRPVPAGPGGARHHPPAQGALLLPPQELLVLQLRADLCTRWPHLPLPRLPVDGRLRDPGPQGGYRQALSTPPLTPGSHPAVGYWARLRRDSWDRLPPAHSVSGMVLQGPDQGCALRGHRRRQLGATLRISGSWVLAEGKHAVH